MKIHLDECASINGADESYNCTDPGLPFLPKFAIKYVHACTFMRLFSITGEENR
jgi:hypothetical protein